MTYIAKLLLFIFISILSVYSIRVFGVGVWSALVFCAGLIIVISVWVPGLHMAAVVLTKALAIICVFVFVLLMLAATVGGSFRLSESNQVVAINLVCIGLLASTAFFWKV